jgi:hypothetical protein
MTPYVVQIGDILPEEIALAELVKEIFAGLSDRGYIVSCHHLCHALAAVFNLTVEDGHFGLGMEHSWLMLRDRSPDGKIILDVYPIAGTGPFLIYAHWNTPWRPLYKTDTSVMARVRQMDPMFDERVLSFADEIKRFLVTKSGLQTAS